MHILQRRRHRRVCACAASVAVLVFSCCMLSARSFTYANNIVAPRASSALSAASRTGADEGGTVIGGSSGTEIYRRQRPQPQNKQRSSRGRSSQDDAAPSRRKGKRQITQCREGEVQKWLMQSTSLVLGEERTLQLVNGDARDPGSIPQGRNGMPSWSGDNGSGQNLPAHFSSAEEFVLNAESVMGAWCEWSSCCSIDGGSSSQSSGEGVVRCSTMTAAEIVDAILRRVLDVVGINEEGERVVCQVRGVEWEGKLVELVHSAIDAWSTVENGGGESVERSESWLRYLQQRVGSEGGGGSDHSKSVLNLYEECHKGVIKACIRSQEPKQLAKAVALLDELRMQRKTLGVIPTTQTYNLVLYGLANCEPSEENARRAEELLKDMISCQHNACSPDSNTFRQVVIAWTKSGSESAAKNARRVLDRMVSDFPHLDPDPSTFNALMTLYLDLLGKTWKAMEIFDWMTSLHQSGRIATLPDTYSVNLILKAISPFSSLEEMNAAEKLLEKYHMQSDVQSYNIVIDAWAKSHLQVGAARAKLLLDRMEQKCQQDKSIAPDAYSYVSTINAIQRSRHEARGTWAEEIYHRMEKMHSKGLVEKPNTPVYNALLNALITCDESGSLQRAEDLFSYMDTAGLATTRSFNTVLKEYARARRRSDGGKSYSLPRKAEELLARMELAYYSKGLASGLRPDKYSYTTVITAYGRSNVKRKAAKALLILQRMIDSYLEGNSAAKPGTFAFNAVLNACSHTRPQEERVEAFTIACSTLILQREWAKPDHTTYGIFLQVCSRLLPKDEGRQWSVVETVFNSCIKEGLCGELVLKNLKGTPELYEALVGKFLTDDDLDIPAQWRRNVAGDSTATTLKFQL